MPSKLGSIFKDLKSANKYVVAAVIIFVILGSVFRFTNLFHLGFVFDMISTQYTWAEGGLKYGYGAFWSDYKGSIDYLPGSLLLIMGIDKLSKFLDPIIPGGSDQAFVTTLKIFNWLTDIGLALFIYKIGIEFAKISKNRAAIAGAFTYFLPSIAYVTGVWGQWDSLVVLLAIIVVFLIYKGEAETKTSFWKSRLFWSGVLFSVAFWLKPLIVLLVPLILALNLIGKSGKEISKVILQIIFWMLAYSATILLGVYLYFNSVDSALTINLTNALFFTVILIYSIVKFINAKPEWYKISAQTVGFMSATFLVVILPVLYNAALVTLMIMLPFVKENNVTSGAATFWPMVNISGMGSDKIFSVFGVGPSVSLTGTLIFLSLFGYAYWRFNKERLQEIKFDKKNLLSSFFNLLEKLVPTNFSFENFTLLTVTLWSAYFMFMMKMHSRYLIWAVIFSLVYFVFTLKTKQWKLWLAGIIIMNVGFFLNQVGVFNGWNAEPQWSHQLGDAMNFDYGKLASLLNLVGLVLFYIYLIRGGFENKK